MEYRCGMRIGLGLELGSRVWVWFMARVRVVVRVVILLCSSITQFPHNFTHYTLHRCIMGTVLRLGLGSVVSFGGLGLELSLGSRL